jgi:hypothetical protein
MRDRASRRVPPAVVAGRATPRVSSRPHEPTIAPPGFFFEQRERKGCVMHGSAVRRRSPVRSRAFDRDRVLPDTAFERITPRGINRARADVIDAAPRDRPPNFSPLVPVIRPVSPPNFVKNHIRKMRPYASRSLTVHRPFFHPTGRGSRRGGSQGCRQEGAQEG